MCHTSSYGRNQFGTDYDQNGRSILAFALIECHDSDEDGFKNIEEIKAGMYPGDAGSFPDVANVPPTVYAGDDQDVNAGATVVLDGSGSSDSDGTIESYSWTQTGSGTRVTLTNASTANPTFTAPNASETLTFELAVTADVCAETTDFVYVNVNALQVNNPPVADAGADQTVSLGDTVTLDGSGSSDTDGDALNFNWSFSSVPVGSAAALSNSSVVNPTFVADLPGTYEVQLTVNDGTVDSATDTVIIGTQNSAPVANAGPDQSVLVGDTVTLDGSSSNDTDGDALTFNWSFSSVPEGSEATLSDSPMVNPTFVADLPGTYVAQLIVNDGTLDSTTDTVTISTKNSAPVAEAGKRQRAQVGDTVTLDGSQSTDADGDPLTFSWSFSSQPEGSIASLPASAGNGVTFTFVPDIPGTYVVQLIVNDGTLNSDPDTCPVKVRKQNRNAGKGGGKGNGKGPGSGN